MRHHYSCWSEPSLATVLKLAAFLLLRSGHSDELSSMLQTALSLASLTSTYNDTMLKIEYRGQRAENERDMNIKEAEVTRLALLYETKKMQ